jgi:hypothetical protein
VIVSLVEANLLSDMLIWLIAHEQITAVKKAAENFDFNALESRTEDKKYLSV